MKKDSLIKGTIILAAAALVARFLGIFQRVPLDYMLTEEGGTYFGTANTIYLLLLTVATAGIPSTVSKMISERYAQGKVSEAKQIYRAALLFGIMAGILMSTLLFLLAPFIATNISANPGAALAIRAIAPALLFFPIIAMMRGYFQGRQLMAAGGISQIIEQILRVVVGVGLAFIVLSIGYSDEWIAAAATFGSVLGGIGALAIMIWYAAKLRRHDAQEAETKRSRRASLDAAGIMSVRKPETSRKLRASEIYRDIFKISIPIVLTAITVNLFYAFDATLFMRLTSAFYTDDAAHSALNALTIKAQSIAGIPPILAIALSTSIIPVISSAYAVNKLDEVRRQVSLVMRIVVYTGVPAALVLTVASQSITGLLFEPGGSGVVAALTAGTIFQITMMTSNSILFGMSKPRLAMRHTLIGMAVKAAGSVALAPFLGVYGLIIASTAAFLLISMLNNAAVRREVNFEVLGKRWVPYLAVIAITAGAGWGLDAAGLYMLQGIWYKLACFLTAAVSGSVMGGLYLVLLVVLRVVTPTEAAAFPKPLRKVFGILLRLFGRERHAKKDA
ncbi:putative polysaccharide biosynthesis protein [Paenibacillus sambharensis]|nr:polysaccharide biosynthesis protein [Paenibacillus sambharensis]